MGVRDNGQVSFWTGVLIWEQAPCCDLRAGGIRKLDSDLVCGQSVIEATCERNHQFEPSRASKHELGVDRIRERDGDWRKLWAVADGGDEGRGLIMRGYGVEVGDFDGLYDRSGHWKKPEAGVDGGGASREPVKCHVILGTNAIERGAWEHAYLETRFYDQQGVWKCSIGFVNKSVKFF